MSKDPPVDLREEMSSYARHPDGLPSEAQSVLKKDQINQNTEPDHTEADFANFKNLTNPFGNSFNLISGQDVTFQNSPSQNSQLLSLASEPRHSSPKDVAKKEQSSTVFTTKMLSMKGPAESVNQRFSQNIDPLLQVQTGIFLGNLDAACNKTLLSRHEIKHIISITVGHSSELPSRNKRVQNHIINLNAGGLPIHIEHHNSLGNLNVLQSFLPAIDIMKRCLLAKGSILVSCKTALTLSPAVVIAYFIKERGMTFDSALKSLQRAQGQTTNYGGVFFLPPGIIYQLKLFQRLLKVVMKQTDQIRSGDIQPLIQDIQQNGQGFTQGFSSGRLLNQDSRDEILSSEGDVYSLPNQTIRIDRQAIQVAPQLSQPEVTTGRLETLRMNDYGSTQQPLSIKTDLNLVEPKPQESTVLENADTNVILEKEAREEEDRYSPATGISSPQLQPIVTNLVLPGRVQELEMTSPSFTPSLIPSKNYQDDNMASKYNNSPGTILAKPNSNKNSSENIAITLPQNYVTNAIIDKVEGPSGEMSETERHSATLNSFFQPKSDDQSYLIHTLKQVQKDLLLSKIWINKYQSPRQSPKNSSTKLPPRKQSPQEKYEERRVKDKIREARVEQTLMVSRAAMFLRGRPMFMSPSDQELTNHLMEMEEQETQNYNNTTHQDFMKSSVDRQRTPQEFDLNMESTFKPSMRLQPQFSPKQDTDGHSSRRRVLNITNQSFKNGIGLKSRSPNETSRSPNTKYDDSMENQNIEVGELKVEGTNQGFTGADSNVNPDTTHSLFKNNAEMSRTTAKLGEKINKEHGLESRKTEKDKINESAADLDSQKPIEPDEGGRAQGKVLTQDNFNLEKRKTSPNHLRFQEINIKNLHTKKKRKVDQYRKSKGSNNDLEMLSKDKEGFKKLSPHDGGVSRKPTRKNLKEPLTRTNSSKSNLNTVDLKLGSDANTTKTSFTNHKKSNLNSELQQHLQERLNSSFNEESIRINTEMNLRNFARTKVQSLPRVQPTLKVHSLFKQQFLNQIQMEQIAKEQMMQSSEGFAMPLSGSLNFGNHKLSAQLGYPQTTTNRNRKNLQFSTVQPLQVPSHLKKLGGSPSNEQTMVINQGCRDILNQDPFHKIRGSRAQLQHQFFDIQSHNFGIRNQSVRGHTSIEKFIHLKKFDQSLPMISRLEKGRISPFQPPSRNPSSLANIQNDQLNSSRIKFDLLERIKSNKKDLNKQKYETVGDENSKDPKDKEKDLDESPTASNNANISQELGLEDRRISPFQTRNSQGMFPSISKRQTPNQDLSDVDMSATKTPAVKQPSMTHSEEAAEKDKVDPPENLEKTILKKELNSSGFMSLNPSQMQSRAKIEKNDEEIFGFTSRIQRGFLSPRLTNAASFKFNTVKFKTIDADEKRLRELHKDTKKILKVSEIEQEELTKLEDANPNIEAKQHHQIPRLSTNQDDSQFGVYSSLGMYQNILQTNYTPNNQDAELSNDLVKLQNQKNKILRSARTGSVMLGAVKEHIKMLNNNKKVTPLNLGNTSLNKDFSKMALQSKIVIPNPMRELKEVGTGIDLGMELGDQETTNSEQQSIAHIFAVQVQRDTHPHNPLSDIQKNSYPEQDHHRGFRVRHKSMIQRQKQNMIKKHAQSVVRQVAMEEGVVRNSLFQRLQKKKMSEILVQRQPLVQKNLVPLIPQESLKFDYSSNKLVVKEAYGAAFDSESKTYPIKVQHQESCLTPSQITSMPGLLDSRPNTDHEEAGRHSSAMKEQREQRSNLRTILLSSREHQSQQFQQHILSQAVVESELKENQGDTKTKSNGFEGHRQVTEPLSPEPEI